MNEHLRELIDLYKQTKIANLRVFNFVICFVSVFSGAVELMRVFATEYRLPAVVTFFNTITYDIAFSIIMILLGICVVIFARLKTPYRITLFLLTCLWGYLAFSYLFRAIFVTINFNYVLIVPVIAQLLYMMKTSAFLDEVT